METPSFRDTRAMEYLQWRSVDRKWSKSKREKLVLGCKIGSVEPLKQIWDTELQDLEFALLGFDLAFIQYFFTMPSSFPAFFETVTYILCHFMLEACNLILDFTGVAIKRLP